VTLTAGRQNSLFVMAGLVPAIPFFAISEHKDVDAQHKAGHDVRDIGAQYG
jgi:hypothetical protein